MSEVCGSHQELAISITRIEGKIDNINEKMEIYKTHIKESIPVRDTVRDNEKFCRSATKLLWLVVASLIGLTIRAILQ